jgi:integrase
LKIVGLRPYDFRHSMLTAVYDETKDLRVTGQLGGHRSERTTKRYTIAAVAPHVQAAIDRVRDRLATAVATTKSETMRNLGKSRESDAASATRSTEEKRRK